MRWSVRVARVGGTEIRIHLTFLLLLALFALAYAAEGGVAAGVGAVVFLLLLFASVLLHELGHALAARRYGISTEDITLLPIGGMARVRRLPRDPRQELVVALAGPAVTAGIVAALFLLLRAVPGSGSPEGAEPWRAFAGEFLAANVVLLVFNLLPAFPMDGGRVLRAALAMRMDYARATRAAAAVGRVFALLFGALGLVANPLLVLIAVFVYLGGREEAAAAEVQEMAARLPVSAAMVTDFRALAPDATLGGAADLLLATAQHDFPVVDAAGRVCGVLTRARLVDALARTGPRAAVASAMEAAAAPVGRDSALDEGFRRMREGRSPLVPVTDADGRLVGLLTPESLAEMAMVRGALARAGSPVGGRGASDARVAQATSG